jgi:hypothetical protein
MPDGGICSKHGAQAWEREWRFFNWIIRELRGGSGQSSGWCWNVLSLSIAVHRWLKIFSFREQRTKVVGRDLQVSFRRSQTEKQSEPAMDSDKQRSKKMADFH